MKDHRTLELDKHPWQIELLVPLLKPLEKGESIRFEKGGIRRCFPHEIMEGTIELIRPSAVFLGENLYEVMTRYGIDFCYCLDGNDLLLFLEKYFSKTGDK